MKAQLFKHIKGGTFYLHDAKLIKIESLIQNNSITLETLKHRLDQMYLEEKYVATLSDRQKLFHQVWDKWQPVFCIQK